MTAGKTYNAGTIFLQVVPVFGDTMRKIKREVEDMDRALAHDTSKALEEGIDKGSKKGAEALERNLKGAGKKAGEQAGDDYAGAFGERLKSAVRSAEREIARIDFKTASEESLKNLDRVKKKLGELKDVQIDADFNAKKALAEIAAVESALAALNKDRDIDIDFNMEKATKDLAKLRKMVDDFVASKIEIKPEVDLKQVDRAMDSFEKKVRATAKKAAESLGEPVTKELRQIKREIESISEAEFGIDIDSKDAYRKLQQLEFRLAEVSRGGDIDVVVNAHEAIRDIAALRKQFSSIDGDTLHVRVDVEADRSIRNLNILSRLMRSFGREQKALARANGDAANSFRAFNILILGAVTLLPTLIPMVAALGGALLALLPIMAGVGAGLGVMIMGFSGVGDAVKALGDQQREGSKEAEAHAKAVRDAAERVSDAQRALARAREDAADRNADAARAVARAEQDAAEMIESALERQADAERALADAQRDAREAQVALMEARREAQQDMEDIADRMRQNALDIRQAQLDLFEAQSEYDAAIADPAATNVEKEQASINLGNAKERLHELYEVEKSLNDERKKGVNGQPRVQSAQEALAAALERQREAQENVRDAAEDVARAQIDAAERVADAVQAQQRAQEDGIEAISDANRNLVRAQEDYRDTLDQTTTSAENLEEAMSKLGPAGQKFARYIHSLRGYFWDLRDAIQTGMLPGVQTMMETVLGRYGTGLRDFAATMGTVIGDLFREFGKMLTNPMWTEFFGMMAELGPKFMREFGQTSMNWLSIFARILTIAAPWAERFSAAMLAMSENALGFLQSEKGTKAWESFLAYAFEVGPKVLKFIGSLWGALVNIGKALAPWAELIMGALSAFLDFIAEMDPKTLGVIVTGVLAIVAIFQIMTGIIAIATSAALLFATTAAGAFLHPVALIVGAILAVIAIIVILYVQFEWFRDAVHAVMDAIGFVINWLWENIVKPAFEGIAAIFKTIAKQIKRIWDEDLAPVWATFIEVVSWLWDKVIKPVFKFIWEYWKALAKVFAWVWKNVLWPVLDMVAAITWGLWRGAFKVIFGLIKIGWKLMAEGIKAVWKHVIAPVLRMFGIAVSGDLVQAFKDAVDNIGNLWESLKSALAAPVRFVIETLLNDGLIKGFNKIADFLGTKKIPDIPLPDFANKNKTKNSNPDLQNRGGIQRAAGGVLPGWTPGRDVHHFVSPTGGRLHLSGGEAVMRPEWTAAMGTGYVEEMNRIARTEGISGLRKRLRGGAFARGGVIPAPGFWNRHYEGYPWASWAGDINVPGSGDYGNLVKAYKEGTVAAVKELSTSYGHHVRVNHPDGSQTLYAHLSGISVSPGQKVRAGQAIGRVGSTGNSSGPHLHFEIINGHAPVGTAEAGVGGGGLPGWLERIIGTPMEWAKGLFNKGMDLMADKFGDSPFLKMVAGFGKKLIGPLVDKLMSFFDGDEGSEGDPGLIPDNGVRRIVQSMAQAYGWGRGDQWDALAEIIHRESSWDPNAANPSSSARGLFQKMTSIHGPLEGSVEGQAKWGLEYIKSTYGNPMNALMHHNMKGWYSDGGVIGGEGLADNGTMMYDNGGYLPPGLTTVLNLTGKPEPVFTADQWDRVQGGGGAGFTYAPTFEGSDLTAEDVADDLLFAFRRIEHGGKYAGARD